MCVFRLGVLCDVTLVAGDLEVRCHKSVLASCSQYFFAMFTNEMSESKASRIELMEIDPSALSLLIDFVYTSEIHVTEDNVQVSHFTFSFISSWPIGRGGTF